MHMTITLPIGREDPLPVAKKPIKLLPLRKVARLHGRTARGFCCSQPRLRCRVCVIRDVPKHARLAPVAKLAHLMTQHTPFMYIISYEYIHTYI